LQSSVEHRLCRRRDQRRRNNDRGDLLGGYVSDQHQNSRGDGGRPRRRRLPMRAIEYQLENADPPPPFPVAKGSVVRLFGPEGVRKSQIATNITALVSHHGLVIYSSYEELPLEESLHPRLEAAGANHANVDTVQLPPLGPNGRGIDEWRRRIGSDKPFLVVLDTDQQHTTVNVTHPLYAHVAARVAELMAETHASALILNHTLASLKPNGPAVAKVVREHMRMGYLVAIDPNDGDRSIVACAKWSHGDPHEIPSATFEQRSVTMNLRTLSGARKKQSVSFVEYVGESDLLDVDLVAALATPAARIGRPPEKYESCAHDLDQLRPLLMPRKDVFEHLKALGHKPTIIKLAIKNMCEKTQGVGTQVLLSLKHDYLVADNEGLYDANDEGE
jgi:hypothetical protein